MSFTKIDKQQQFEPPIPKSYLERSRSILSYSLIIFFTILLVMLVPISFLSLFRLQGHFSHFLGFKVILVNL